MSVPKKIFYPAVFVIISVVCLLFFFTFYLFSSYSKDSANCLKENDFFTFEKCGYVLRSDDNSYNTIVGVLKEKSKSNDILYLKILTADSNAKPITQQISLPQQEESVSLGIPKGSELFYIGVDPKNAYDKLSEGQFVVAEIPIPPKEILVDLENKSINRNLVKCSGVNEEFIKYLKKSSLFNLISFKLSELLMGCSPSTIQITLL